MTFHRLLFKLLLCVVFLMGISTPAKGQLPNTRLLGLSPAGGQVGKSFDTKLIGKDLDGVTQLQFSHPGIKAQQKVGKRKNQKPAPLPNQFTVTVSAEVPPGIYEVRAVGLNGASSPRAVRVTQDPHQPETESNDEIEKAQAIKRNVVIDGFSNRNGDLDFYKFSAKKGERILIECAAQRIDSLMEPILAVFDLNGNVVQECRDTFRHDAILDFTAEADGDYVVRVCDLTYAGGNDRFYQLRLHQDPQIDFVFPPSASPGSKTQFTFYGRNLPGGKTSNKKIHGKPLQELTLSLDVPKQPTDDGRILAFQTKRISVLTTAPANSTDGFCYQWNDKKKFSNQVFIAFATAPVVPEVEPNNEPGKAQKITLPCEIAGQFSPVNDKDWFTFDAKKGEVFQFEVISQRMGIATDPFLVVQQVLPDGKVKDLTSLETFWDSKEIRKIDQESRNVGFFAYNTRSDDVYYQLKVPADGTYRVLIRDLYFTARDEVGAVYRLSIRNLQPHFRLLAISHYPEDLFPMNRQRHPWTPVLRRGGTEQIDVVIYRWDGLTGDVEVTLEGLPEGVSCSKAVCRADEMTAPLVLTASGDAKAWDGPVKVVGRAVVDGKEMVQQADYGTVIWFGQNRHWGCRARQTRELWISVREDDDPFRVELGEQKEWKTQPGKTIKVPAKVIRQGKFDGPVQLLSTAMPPGIKSKAMTIGKGKDQGFVELKIEKNALPGTHYFYFEAKASVPFEAKRPPGVRKPKGKSKPFNVRPPTTMLTLVIEEPAPKKKPSPPKK